MNKFEPDNHRGDILIVDDTLSNLQVLADMLDERGYLVRGASDGATALMVVETRPPDLILLDVLMPGIDGYKVCRQLQDVAPGVPVIFLSALDQTLDKVRAFEAGGVDYITKPFQLEEVLARVQTHLSLTSLKRRLEAQNAQLQREIQERERAERALQRAHDELERRVEERTAALQRSEAATKAILDAVPDLMFHLDGDGTCLNFVSAATDGLIAPPEEFLCQKIYHVLPPEVAEDHMCCVSKALQCGEMQVAEYQLRVSGAIRHYEARFVVSGENSVLVLARDVTERKRAEEQLLRTTASLQQAERLAHLGSWEIDIASGQSRWSDEFFRICGYEPGALEPLAEIALQIIHPDDRQRAAAAVRRACERGEPYRLEIRIVRPAGEVRHVLAQGEVVHNGGRRPVKMVGSFLDITEQVRAREALRESEEKYRLLVENQNDLVVKFDVEGRLLFTSPTYCKTFGKTEDELLNEQFMPLIHEDDRERVAASLATLAVDKRTTYHEERALTVDGWRWFGWSARGVFDQDGNIQTIISVGRDITNRVRAEAELRARNAELDRFTYTVSHDLKNPLVTITGFLGFLERDIAAGDAERVQADVARISNAALRMERLLDELLQLSRVGRVVNPPEEMPLSELLRDALDMVAGKLTMRGVQVQFAGEMSRADELVIYGDRTRLLQVLQNLLDNAIKFMGDQPQPRVEIGAQRDDARGMVYYVRDNGIGIDPAHHEEIFDLFNKLDSEVEGSGVGLALVKRIVEVHGGSVWVESEGAGQGSVFYFTIPGQSDQTRGGQT